jgi:hypothetical protein
MTREAVREQMRLISEAVGEGWTERLSVSNAFGWGFVPSAVDSLVVFFFGSGIREEMMRLRTGYERGLKASLDYAEEIALGGGSFGKYEDEILGTDGWYARYEGDHAEGFAEELVERYRRIGDAFTPIVRSDETGFWEAARDVYTRDETVNALRRVLGYSDLLGTYSDDVNLRTAVASMEVEYTDEALRALRVTEEDVLGRLTAKADAFY